MRLSRRDALRAFVAAGVGVCAGPLAYGGCYARHHLTRIEQELPVTGLPPALDGLRIGLITDIHHSATVGADDITHAVELVRSAKPDLIVLGGDYITSFDRSYAVPSAELLAPLANAAPHGSFAVFGNHDDDKEMPAALLARGFTLLRDKRTQITIRGEPIDIAGINFWTKQTNQLAAVLKGAGPTTILLAHDPRRLPQAASFNVPLVLSGHTHGGQVLLPGIGAVAAREFPVLAGMARQDNTTIYVSRGVGTVWVPVRLNCPPDVSILTLRTTFGNS